MSVAGRLVCCQTALTCHALLLFLLLAAEAFAAAMHLRFVE
jgi:hypothetical protein